MTAKTAISDLAAKKAIYRIRYRLSSPADGGIGYRTGLAGSWRSNRRRIGEAARQCWRAAWLAYR
jgi:hypothetical protein